MTRSIAFFDFDGTLVKGDSLLPYLGYAAGWGRMMSAFALSLLRPDQGHPDYRTAVKAALLRRTLTGLPLEQARAAAEKLGALKHWKQPAHRELLRLKSEGCIIIVATGALELYIGALLRDLPIDGILSTEMEVKDGLLTGFMQGGNCVRQEKARRVAEYLQTHGPFTKTHGYGNAPSDLPMLALLDEKTVV